MDHNSTFVQSDYHYMVAELLSFQGQSSKALAHFEFAAHLKTRGHQEILQLRMAKEYLKQGMGHQAQKLSQKLSDDSKIPSILIEAYQLLGSLYSSMDLLKMATSEYQKILNIDPTNEEALLNQSLLLAEMGSEISSKTRWKAAQNPRFHRYMGDIYWMRGNYKKASESFKKALLLNPLDRVCALRLFQIYHQRNEGLKWIQMMENFSNHTTFIDSLLAQAYLKQGNPKKALEKMENLLWDDPLAQKLRQNWTKL